MNGLKQHQLAFLITWLLVIVCRLFMAIVLAEAYFKPDVLFTCSWPGAEPSSRWRFTNCHLCRIEDSKRCSPARNACVHVMPAEKCLLVVCLLNWNPWQRTHQHSAVYVTPQDLESRLPLTRRQEAGKKGKERPGETGEGRERSRRKVTAVAVCNCDDENQTSFISPSHSLPSSFTILASCPSLFSLTLCSQK